MEIHTVKVPEKMEQCAFDRMLQVVAEDTCQTVQKFARRTDAQNTLAGEVLIRWLAGRHTGLQNQDIRFSRNRFGKPFIAGTNNFHFNLSHSGCWVACAIDSVEVGVDVEEIKEIDLGIAQSFFSQSEYHDLMRCSASQRLSYFYELWTLKESYIKAIGKGLSEPLQSFSIQVQNQQIHYTACSNSAPVFFQKWDFLGGYKLAACSFKATKATTLYIHHFDDLMKSW